MRVELSRREEIVISLVIAAIVGALFSGLFNFASSRGPALNMSINNLTVEDQQILNASNLGQRVNGSAGFPPSLYVFEWIEFEIDLYGISGMLEVNLTRDGQVIHTMALLRDSTKIVLKGFGEYRFHKSSLDATFRAINGRVAIESIYVSMSRGTNEYNPILGAISVPLALSLFVIPLSRRTKTQTAAQKTEGKLGSSF